MASSPLSPLSLLDASRAGTTWPDDVVDLADRRRLLVLAVLGVDLTGPAVDRLFCVDDDQWSSSSTTRRSAGRVPSTEDT